MVHTSDTDSAETAVAGVGYLGVNRQVVVEPILLFHGEVGEIHEVEVGGAASAASATTSAAIAAISRLDADKGLLVGRISI